MEIDDHRCLKIKQTGAKTMENIQKRIDEIDDKLYLIRKEIDDKDVTSEKLEDIEKRANKLVDEKRELKLKQRSQREEYVLNGGGEIIKRFGDDKMENNINTVNENVESRALQSYITKGLGSMDDVEKRALDISGSAAALPTEVMNTLVTSTKYSDLLNRSTVITQGGFNKMYIPIASNTTGDWKIENSTVDGSSATYEASPTLTKLELGGYELMRLMRISAASFSMTASNFISHLMQLLSGEVVETLENAFITGTGSAQPKGLDNLTWTPDTNQILTTSSATPIQAEDVAEALSLLPQKYARNAIVLLNSEMLYKMQTFKGTAEYIYNMSESANKFLGKEIVVSEHMSDDTVYIGDPKEIYVRFAQPIQVEADKSSGFTAGSIDLRALTVVDAVINPAAWVAVGLGAA